MSQQYEEPAPISGDTINFQELNGSLILVAVQEALDHVPNANTKPGEKSPAVRADVDVLDGPQGNTHLANTLVFPKVLRAQLARSVGKTVLGRLGQGQAKTGQSAPWELMPPTAADKAVADQFIIRRQQGQVGQPEPPF